MNITFQFVEILPDYDNNFILIFTILFISSINTILKLVFQVEMFMWTSVLWVLSEYALYWRKAYLTFLLYLMTNIVINITVHWLINDLDTG